MSKRFVILGALVIALTGLIAYQPDLKIGHEGGWWFLDWVSRFSTWEYILQFFDPGRVTQGYRPMQGMMILGEYSLFQFNADGYHVAQMLMHIVTCWLMFALVAHLARNTRLAFIAAFFFALIPAYHLALFRAPAVIDPWAGMFYLGTIWLWVEYLATRRARFYALTLFVFALALLSKEVSIFLPGLMYLIERWFVMQPNLALPQTAKPSWTHMVTRLIPQRAEWLPAILRYAGLGIVMIPYLMLELNVQSHGEFSSQFGYQLGLHFLANLIPYLAMLSTPWSIDNYVVPTDWLTYLWLSGIGIALVAATIIKRSAVILFLFIFAAINISPLLGFPLDWFQARYLYFSYMSTAILFAMVFDAAWSWLRQPRAYWRVGAGALAIIALLNGQLLSVKAGIWAEYTRELRVPFRDISSQHPAFPENTLLYFLYPTTTSLQVFQGLFLVRYGQGLTVSGTDEIGYPALQNYKNVFFYYFDEANRPREIAIDRSKIVRASPTLPADFEAPVRLEGFDIVNPTVKHGEPLIVLLHWSPRAKMNQDYTIFVHLLDSRGQLRAQADTQPRRGTLPTSQWRMPIPLSDAILLPITSDVAPGTYRLELGLYDQATLQRFAVVNANGQPIGDTIVIEPLGVIGD